MRATTYQQPHPLLIEGNVVGTTPIRSEVRLYGPVMTVPAIHADQAADPPIVGKPAEYAEAWSAILDRIELRVVGSAHDAKAVLAAKLRQIANDLDAERL